MVQVSVNGQGPFDFLLDTAATTTAIFKNLQAALDVDTEPVRQIRVFSLSDIESKPVARLDTLSIGGLSFNEIDAVIFDDWGGQTPTPAGIIGLDILTDYFPVIDPVNGHLSLYAKDTPPWELIANWDKSEMYTDSFGFAGLSLYLLEARIGYKRFPLLLDTGASISIGNVALVSYLPTFPRRELPSGETTLSGANDIETIVMLLRATNARTGGISWEDVEFYISRASIFEELGFASEPIGILGYQEFSERGFALDFENNQFYRAPKR
ncbi:MAG: aspartyl protease family protein [Pseudomonadota bacterium]